MLTCRIRATNRQGPLRYFHISIFLMIRRKKVMMHSLLIIIENTRLRYTNSSQLVPLLLQLFAALYSSRTAHIHSSDCKQGVELVTANKHSESARHIGLPKMAYQHDLNFDSIISLSACCRFSPMSSWLYTTLH